MEFKRWHLSEKFGNRIYVRSYSGILAASKVNSYFLLPFHRTKPCIDNNHYRVLAVGWNNHIVEFPDTHENDVSGESDWMTCHDDDVFSAAVRDPEVILLRRRVSYYSKLQCIVFHRWLLRPAMLEVLYFGSYEQGNRFENVMLQTHPYQLRSVLFLR